MNTVWPTKKTIKKEDSADTALCLKHGRHSHHRMYMKRVNGFLVVEWVES